MLNVSTLVIICDARFFLSINLFYRVKENLKKAGLTNAIVMAINWRSHLFLDEYKKMKAVSIRKLHKVRDFMTNALCNVLFFKTQKPNQWKEIMDSTKIRIDGCIDAFHHYTGKHPTIDILSFRK